MLDVDSYVNVVIVALLVGPIDAERRTTAVISRRVPRVARSFGSRLASSAAVRVAFQTAAEFLQPMVDFDAASARFAKEQASRRKQTVAKKEQDAKELARTRRLQAKWEADAAERRAAAAAQQAV